MYAVISEINYVERFTTVLIDKWDGDVSVDKAIAILHSVGYNGLLIATYVDQAHNQAKELLTKWHVKTIS